MRHRTTKSNAARAPYDRIAAGMFALVSTATPAVAAQEISTYHLDNGAAVVVMPKPNSTMVAVQAWISAGAANEPASANGVAHALEHMLFKGSAAFEVGELTRSIAATGGEINAWTSLDHTVVHASAPGPHVDDLIVGVADTICNPRFDADSFATEKQVILDELRLTQRDPMRRASQQLFATAFCNHPYRRSVIGTEASVGKLALRDVVDYFRNWFVGRNLTMVVVGDVDPGQIEKVCKRRLSGLPANGASYSRSAEPEQSSLRVAAPQAADHGKDAYAAIGFRAPSVRSSEFAALDVAALLLGQRPGARLGLALQEQAPATSSFAQLHATKDPSLFAIAMQTHKSQLAKALATALRTVALFATTITDEEVALAKTLIEGNQIRQSETVSGQARSLGWNNATTGNPAFHFVYLDRIRRLTKSDVEHAARRYLVPTSGSIAVVGQPVSARSLAATAATAFKSKTPAPATDVSEQRVVLPSGVTLLVKRDPSIALVAARAVWAGGVRLETEANNGISALLARTLTSACTPADGTKLKKKQRSNAGATAKQRLEDLGAGVVAVSGRNSLSIAAEFLTPSWLQGFEVLSNCINTPVFDTASFAQQKAQLVAELQSSNTNPSTVAFRNFLSTRFAGHPYRLDPNGLAKAVSAISKAQLQEFFTKHYATAPLTIAIVGDIEPAAAIAAAEKIFAGGPTRAPVAVPAPTSATKAAKSATRTNQVFEFLGERDASVVIGFGGTKVDAADRFAVEVMTAALAGQNGRLFAALREKLGLVYRINVTSVEGIDPGFIAIAFTCDASKLDQAVSEVRKEIETLVRDGLDAAELARIQSSLKGQHASHLQRRAALASAMAFHEAYGLHWQGYAKYDEQVQAVDRAAVLAAANTYLQWDTATISIVRPRAMTKGALKRSRIGKR